MMALRLQFGELGGSLQGKYLVLNLVTRYPSIAYTFQIIPVSGTTNNRINLWPRENREMKGNQAKVSVEVAKG